ncbi:hypothetical protein WDZ92_43375, partial [Nostoc sp. NIES-2111]
MMQLQGAPRRTTLSAVLAALAAGAMMWVMPTAAQSPPIPPDFVDVPDQPGFVPSEESQQLSGPWEKQVVFFRTTEAPGTIKLQAACLVERAGWPEMAEQRARRNLVFYSPSLWPARAINCGLL